LHRNVRRANTFEPWSVTTSIWVRSAGSIPMIAFVVGTAARSRDNLAFRFQSPRKNTTSVRHERPPSMRGTPSPTSAQEDVR
jgi:hypothetical protein